MYYLNAGKFTDKLKIKTQHFKAEQFVWNDVKKILDNCHYLVDKSIGIRKGGESITRL